MVRMILIGAALVVMAVIALVELAWLAIFDCGGVLGKYEIRLKERKVVNMEALNTYKTEKTLAEQMNERLAEMKMTKAEAALKMNYSRAAL
mgnify:CR=1 FL=1